MRPESLTFTTGDYASEQTVTVDAAQDADAQDASATLSHTAAGGGYDGVVIDLVVVRVTDDDTAGVTLSDVALDVDEGAGVEYTVKLDTEPSGPVTVTASAPSGSGLTVRPESLTFTTGDYATAQTVRVNASQDSDSRDETATLTHAARGGGYDGVGVGALTVTVIDDDAPLAPPALTGTTVAGNQLDLDHDQALDEGSVPAPGDFDVSVGSPGASGASATGAAVLVRKSTGRIDVTEVQVAGAAVSLTLSREVQPGELLTVSYTPGEHPIRSVAGVEAPRIVSAPVMVRPPVPPTLHIAHFESTANPRRQGFVRVVNRSDKEGEVRIVAIDEAGMRSEAVTLSVAAGAARHFNSRDLEQGNEDKGFAPPGVGMTDEGDWRLELESALDIEALAYARTADGFVTSLHDTVPVVGDVHRVAFFNPGGNRLHGTSRN